MITLRNHLENNNFYRIPLKKLESGHYAIPLNINNVSGLFILDTGASSSCLGIDDINYFELISQESTVKAAGAGTLNITTQRTGPVVFKHKKWSIKVPEIICIDLNTINQALQNVNSPKVQGIIGADLLKTTRAVIDYGRNCLYVN